jgi:osmotically-inducible protein OsmY
MTTPQERIKQDLTDELAWDSRVLATDVHVEVSDRTVILSGTVPSHFSRRAALEHARTIPGVVEVIDRIGVRYPEATEIPTDQRIRANVESVLAWNPDVDSDDLQVSVSGGVAKLMGSVNALWKKYHAEELVRTLNGVVGVDNELAIVPKQSRTDQAIAEDVTNKLKRRPNVDLDAIDVMVEDSTVTLSGSVPDIAAEEAALNAARYTDGVREVTDQLTVAS